MRLTDEQTKRLELQEAVRKICEKLRLDDRPEIEVWHISKEHTKAYNQALDDVEKEIK